MNSILENVTRLNSPNSSSRRDRKISTILVHHTGHMTENVTVDKMMAKGTKISCHFIVPRDAKKNVIQLVELERKAWHAGRALFWKDRDVNLFSVGIQLVGTAESGYTDHQYEITAQLIAEIMDRNEKISFNRIVGHESVSERENGPGPLWCWNQFFDCLIRRLYGLNEISRT